MLASSLAIALAGLASLGGAYAQVAAWHMDTLRTLVTARLDSVVSPNQVSSHMHQILGGSAFSAAYSFDALRASKCTTASISADRSNYWMPKLYWVNDDGSFIPIPGGSRFYYFLGRSSPAEPVHPFPEGLRMLQGNPNGKSDNGVSTFTCMVNADLFTGNIYAQEFNFDRDCPYGLRIEVTFPNCWDGVNLYKDDGSHVVFPAGINQRQGSCPWSHPIRIPQIMLEYTWRPDAWAPGQALKGHLAWANGDTTGYGVHADFQNGWDTAVLSAALNNTQCAGELKSQPIQSCEVFTPLYNGNPQCTAERGTLDEPDMLHQDLVPIDHLPGCNPVWGASGSKPGCSTTMPSPNLAGWTGTQQSTVASGAQRKDLVLPTKPGWQQIGCLRDSGSMLTGGGGNYYDNALSVTTCTASCSKSGYNYAAIGMKDGRWDCQCGKGVDPNAGTFPGMCTSPCPGNSKEICGASSVHSVYYAPPGTAAPNASSVATGATGKGYLGCYYPAGDTSLSSKIKFSYTDSALTQEACLQVCANRNMTWAAMSAGRNCMCGTDASVGSGYYQSEASCNMGCAGNSTQMCGWTYGYSVYDVQASGTTAQTTQHPAGWKGCFSDPGMGGLTDFSWTSNSMTPESCSYGCAELGYSLSGLVFGSRCRCGNTWKGGPIYPATQCQIACPGNSSETCGGNYNTEVYDISTYATKVKADVAARPAGWLGCYANSAGVILKDTNTYDSSNSVERCKASCGTYGYAYTGVTNGYYCRCGNVSPNGIATRWPSNFFCGAQCPGNSKQTCGAANSYVDLYNTTTTAPGSGGSLNANPSGYRGCYAGVSGLNGGTFTMSTMTNKVCTTGCKEMGFALAGTSGNNCYCGNSWTTGDLLPDLRCTSKCAGNNTDTCGGYYITSLYNSTVGDTVQAKTEPGYLGCFTDSGSARALTSFSYSSSAMSNAVCKATCAGKGYSLSGTSAQYCYCGNQISNGQTQTTSALCTTPCLGAADRMCGGPGYKISIFNATATAAPSASASAGSGSSGPTFASGGYVQSRGCYSDVTVLDQATYTSGYMTIDQCMSHCKGQNYGFAGVLNGNQCRCGNSAPVVAAGRSLCATQCVSNSTQICGGNGYVDVWPTTQSNYFKDAYAATSADADGDFGCWQDANDRLIKGNTFSSNTNTPESCLANCYAQGYSFSGVEASNQCYCGNSLRKGLIRYDKSVCSYTCAGDNTKNCGGWWAANVRVLPQNGAKPTTSASATSKASGSATGSVSKSSTASASATPSSAAIEGYKGCYAIGTFASSASSKTTGDGTMTINYCRRFCRDQGFANAGVQGGNNCYCGAAMNTLGTKLPDSTCAIDCAGGGGKCGDVYMASMYDTTGAGALTKPDSPANFVGCFVDSNTRILPNYTFSSSVMTSDICRRTCSAKGLTVYGTQAGNQCFCGSTLPKTMVPDAQCGQACAGNQQEKCGGSWRMSVYSPDFQEAAGDTEESPVSSSASSASPSLSPSASMISNSTASSSASASPSVTSSVIASASTSASPIPIASSSTPPAVSSSSVASSSTSAVSSSAAASSASSSLAESSASSSSAAFTSADDVATSSSSSSSATSSASQASSSSAAASPSPSSAASSSASPSSSVAPSSSSAAATSSSAVPTSSAAPSPSPPPSSSAAPSSVSSAAAPSATNHLGCFTQSSTAPVLKESVITCDTLTPGMCKLWCNSNNFAYAGMTNGSTCGCASDISALTSAPASQCSKDCFSDRSAKCGGEVNTYNVWKSSGLIARRAHRRFMRTNHGASPRNQEPLHFNSEREILEYLKRQA